MTTEELLAKLEARGITLGVTGARLTPEAIAPIPQGILTTIRSHEKQLVRHLSRNPQPVSAPPIPLALPAEPPTEARDRTRSATAVCLELLADPPTRDEAVSRLVATFRPEIREAQRRRWTTTVLDGSPVADAAADYLVAEAVGLTAWAWDREVRGLYNLGAWTWVETAKGALGRSAGLDVA